MLTTGLRFDDVPEGISIVELIKRRRPGLITFYLISLTDARQSVVFILPHKLVYTTHWLAYN